MWPDRAGPGDFRTEGLGHDRCPASSDLSDMPSTPLPAVIPGLAAALAVGLLVGLQRGWSVRDQAEGSRVAGLRTFALIGLMGGVLASLPAQMGPWPLAAGLLGLGVLMAVSYRESVRRDRNLSVTSSVA